MAFLLEPDLKEGKGGLRDAAVLGAVGSLLEFIAVDEPTRDAHDELLTIRIELHRTAGRPTDTLLLQDQDEIGGRLAPGGGDEIMAGVAAAGRRISWAGDDAWQRIRAWIDGPRRVRSGARPRDLGVGVMRVDDEIVVAPTPRISAAIVLHAAAEAGRMRLPFERGTVRRLAGSTGAVARPVAGIGARRLRRRCWRRGRRWWPSSRRSTTCGIWMRLIPEWAAVQNRPQRNAFHRFTVDRHLIEAVVQAAPLACPWNGPTCCSSPPSCTTSARATRATTPMPASNWSPPSAPRLGYPDDDVALLQTLVRLHLLLPDTATRRDLDDPKTVDAVAAEVGTRGDARPAGGADGGRRPRHRPDGVDAVAGRPHPRPRRAGSLGARRARSPAPVSRPTSR